VLNLTEVNGEIIGETNEVIQGEKVVVMYRYAKRPDVGGAPEIAGTRDFCRALLSLNRLYSRQDIETISGRVDRNVWLRRGGFWNQGEGKPTTPWCRHIWNQEIITINE